MDLFSFRSMSYSCEASSRTIPRFNDLCFNMFKALLMSLMNNKSDRQTILKLERIRNENWSIKKNGYPANLCRYYYF